MAFIITICNQKGGVGKTSTAVNVASALSANFNQKVLLVDMDPQANASSTFGGLNRERNIYHMLMDEVSPQDILVSTQYPSLHLIPATSDLAGASVDMANQENREFRLYEIIMRLQNDYDFIIIDSPPTMDLLTLNSIVAAHYVIIPVQCEYYAMEGLGQLLSTIEVIRDNLGKEIQVLGAVCTMFDIRNRLSRVVLEEVNKNFPGYVFKSVIPRNVALAEAPGFSKTIFEFNPSSKGAFAYSALTGEIFDILKNKSNNK